MSCRQKTLLVAVPSYISVEEVCSFMLASPCG